MILINFFIFFCSFVIIRSDDPKVMTIDKAETGSLTGKGQVRLYQIIMPPNIADNTSNLILRVRENDEAEEGKDFFSDPDIYVSKENKEPKSPETSTWYSERYGEDIVTIPKEKVKSGETFYIGIFCEKACKYELIGNLVEEYEILEGVLYSNYLTKRSSILYKFRPKAGFNELEIISFAPKLGGYKMYVSKNDSPSSQNSINIIPSWLGGYSCDIIKGKADYCDDCNYHILIQAENEDVEVFLSAKYESTITKLRSVEPVFSSLRAGRSHCYSFEISSWDVKENVIVQTTLFSGSGEIKIIGWDNPSTSPDSLANIDNKWIYPVFSEKVIILTPDDRKEIKGNKTNGDLTFCITSEENASYLIKTYFGSETEELQKFNFLKNGAPLSGYLPSGQATKYRTVDFTQNSNITIQMDVLQGDPILYGYMCENIKECDFTQEKVLSFKEENKLILPSVTGVGYEVNLETKENTCHQKLKTDPSLQDEYKNIPCALLAIVSCQGSDECTYKLTFTYDESITQLYQKKPFYQMIPYNETDYYKITIDDDQTENVAIILNTISGDVDLFVYKDNPLENHEARIVKASQNEMYLPDVVYIRKKSIKDNIKGTYYIAVKSNAFSSYSIYYYTYDKKKTKPTKPAISDVVMELQMGHIIKDYLDETTDHKIYSYNPQLLSGSSDLDIRISITPENSQYSLYVFKDITKMEYKPNEFQRIKNALWESDWTNEVIIISKADANYSPDDDYYIVVLKKYNNIGNTKSSVGFPSYYIGATNENYPFLLNEGMPNMITLTSSYNSQSYNYIHSNTTEPFVLSLNVYYGRVNVYVDFKEITDTSDKDIAYSTLDTDKTFVKFKSDMLQSKCKNVDNCPIFILIVRSSAMDAQYLVTARSHRNQKELLLPSVVKYDSLLGGDHKHYYTYINKEDLTDNVVSVTFSSGLGEVYAKVLREDQPLKGSIFPNETNHEYIGGNYYMGKVINIRKEDFKDCVNCKLLISVQGKSVGYSTNDIEYSIVYYSSARRINQNQPYRDSIKQGEMQFFTFYFGDNTENIYISLTNIEGDADLYLNYGGSYPNFNNYTWHSSSPYHDFIDLSKDDPFFVSKGIKTLGGNYTMMIYGFTNTSYTLYATSHPNKIISVTEGIPASCLCKSSKDICLFRFDEVLNRYSPENTDVEIMVTTDYVYGTGKIYGKLYNDTDYDLISDFPSNSNYAYSSVKNNMRNMMHFKINKDDPKLKADSMILISVECSEKSFFDLNVAKMSKSNVKYIDQSRENLFFLQKSDNATLLIFYNYLEKDLNFEVNVYSGQGEFLVYLNESVWDDNKKAFNHNYEHVAVFELDDAEDSSYHNSMSKSVSRINQNLYFKVTPKTDLSFYVRLNYDQEWTKVKVNKMTTYILSSDKFFGYFDMLDEYSEAILTVQSEDPKMQALVYVKLNLFEKKNDKLDYSFSYPDTVNYDYTATTNEILPSVSLKLPGISKKESKGKYVRYLFQVSTINKAYSENDRKINIIVTPSTNNYSRIEAKQSTYYYGSADSLVEQKNIYDLTKNSPLDDLLVIELSTCTGSTKVLLSDKINYFSDENNLAQKSQTESKGRKLILISPLESDNYFMSITANTNSDKVCLNTETEEYECSYENEYLMYYFTTTQEKFKESFFNMTSALEYEVIDSSEVMLKMPSILSKDNEGKYFKQSKLTYSLIISDNQTDFAYMESVCYLSKMKNNINDMSYSSQDNTMRISKLSPDKKYYVNVLVRNLDTQELIAYRPVEIILGSGGMSSFVIAVIILTIAALTFVAYYFYRKFTITREILKYEVNDVRNLSNVPRSEAEMKAIVDERKNLKYVNLTDDSSKV